MKVEVLAFGKLRGPGLRDAADHYLKLASKFLTITERELKPLAVPDKSDATRLQIQAKEQQLIGACAPLLSALRERGYVLSDGLIQAVLEQVGEG